MLYGIKGATELSADLVIETGNDTYVCVFNPAKVDRSTGSMPIEQQPIWQITLYRTVEVEPDNSESEDETETIVRQQTLYPDGSNAYAYSPADINNYSFMYRL